MNESAIDILMTFDERYLKPFETMLVSLAANHRSTPVRIWLLHRRAAKAMLDEAERYCRALGVGFSAVEVDQRMFAQAPISRRYPQEMYYRLLAPSLLPKSLERILYLDPDMLVLNSFLPLWRLNLDGCCFAAAAHMDHLGVITRFNNMRLDTEEAYYNTGVILMDLKAARARLNPEDIFGCVRENAQSLLLPDQDIFNHLYADQTRPLDDLVWNYDARKYSRYLLASAGVCDMDWVMRNTVFLHFCGKSKPWRRDYSGRFNALYKHYGALAERVK